MEPSITSRILFRPLRVGVIDFDELKIIFSFSTRGTEERSGLDTEGKSNADIQKLLRLALGPTGKIVPTPHAQLRMAEREFDLNDVRKVIRSGRIVERTTEPSGRERFRLEASNQSATDLVICCELASQDGPVVVIVTVFSASWRR